ncbi:MAG TPA: diguanylate cyclase [Gaiellaceae bacterium]|nr:diguanylate cyclase [Gaiellaceae bacterium]
MSNSLFGLPSRLTAFIAATVLIALPVVGLSLASLAVDPPSATTAVAAFVFFALALAADLRPVPMDDSNKSEVSIASVFIVSSAVLLGWRFAVPAAALSIGITFVVIRRPLPHTVFNISMYALSACAAALPVIALGPIHGAPAGRLTAYVLLGGALHLAVNVVLVAGAIAISQQLPYREVVVPGLRQGGAAFAITVFLTALAANLWVTEAWLLVLLAGPAFTLTLYQRSALHSRLATRDALTDHLTGLGNHRAYQAALHDRISESERTGKPFSLCLIDVDDFKGVNDAYGHAAGDDLLVLLGKLLGSTEHAEAFRFGGDEFAIIFRRDEISAYRQLEELQRQLLHAEAASPTGHVTISAGIATFPSHAPDADELQRRADGALYWSKEHGKNRSCLYSPSVVRIYSRDALERETERSARLRAAKNLVRFVDARDPQTANHSELVSALAEGIGVQLGFDAETVEQLKLAGLLHDLGKIGLPDAVLKEARMLTDEESSIVRRHPEFGQALLEGLGLEQVQDWVLHHHEHWDGSGYPDGLAAEEIPLGARIILVADTFAAITTDRPYRAARSEAAALRELRAHAGRQFDPAVVDALELQLGQAPGHLEALA